MTYVKYRIHRQPFKVISSYGNSADVLGNWRPTRLTLNARTPEEAQQKARKMWELGDYGAARILAILEP